MVDHPSGGGERGGAERLVAEGCAHLQAGRYEEARACFVRALALQPLPSARTNLAAVQLQVDGDAEAALATLGPLLVPDAGPPEPFAWALASLCHSARGRRAEAGECLERALRDFDRGLDDARREGTLAERAWCQYTAIALKAAGTLGEDARVWRLYQRWSNLPVPPETRFYGGTAAFNLERFAAAARAWRAAAAAGDWGFLERYADVADRAEEGLVPPFRLRYEPPDIPRYERIVASAREGRDLGEVQRELASDPGFVMVALAYAVCHDEGPVEERSGVLASLVAGSGGWGERLARRLWDSARVPVALKLAAARGLLEAGVLRSGDTVTMWIEGRRQEVRVELRPVVVEPDGEVLDAVREVARLLAAGREDEAMTHLADLVDERGVLWPPLLALYASLLAGRGQLPRARTLAEGAERLWPGNPVFPMLRACLALLAGDAAEAKAALARAGRGRLPRDVRAELRRVREQLVAWLSGRAGEGPGGVEAAAGGPGGRREPS